MQTQIIDESLPDGRRTRRVIHRGADGTLMETSSLGAAIVRYCFPGDVDRSVSVVLGLADAASYWNSPSYFGATVGRFANRIAGGAFAMAGRRFELDRNEGANTLHGGRFGFHRRVWTIEGVSDESVRYRLSSPDGDMGFPGEAHASATYTLLKGGGFSIAYEAMCDSETIVSLANHAYFNLHGEGQGDVLSHDLEVQADHYLPVAEDLIPTGELRAVDNSPFDLRRSRALSDAIALDDPQLKIAGGFDHNFCVGDGPSVPVRPVAAVRESARGRRLLVRASAPGLQVYIGQMLTGVEGRDGRLFRRYGGLCLEAQAWPNAPNCPHFPAATLHPGERYVSLTEYHLADTGI